MRCSCAWSAGTSGDSRAQVLVVDDDPKTREMLRRTLQKAGCTVAEAANGSEAIEALERATPGLVCWT